MNENSLKEIADASNRVLSFDRVLVESPSAGMKRGEFTLFTAKSNVGKSVYLEEQLKNERKD